MRFVIALFLSVASIYVFADLAYAQSTATFIPLQQADDTIAVVPAKPLEVLDTDYPLEALLANEEGSVALNLLIGSDGKVTHGQILKFSGSTRLDQAAVQIARTKWQFQPATKGGEPILGTARVDATWKLPLRPADDIYSEMMGFPVAGRSVIDPKPNLETNKVTVADYPALSIRNGEQGAIALKVVIQTDGKVGQVDLIDSSNFSRLDQSAISMVKNRFTYTPGLVDGQPVEVGHYVLVSFVMRPRYSPTTGRARFCHSRPFIGSRMQMSSDGDSGSIDINQWVHVVEDGTIDDILLLTAKGWMHDSSALIAAANASIRNPPAVSNIRRAPATGSIIASSRTVRRSDCWYNGDYTVTPK